ncbi:deoxyribodipyrimidine photo-lyase [Marinifilum sp. JC120]|nr:deoxyribodipyrimidine photo-lyase [Marinifilum sp. JC120]
MIKVDGRRIHQLNSAEKSDGPIIYWMSREQRVRDNWGLLHAYELTEGRVPLIVVFCLAPSFLGATLRHYDFMLKGLQQVERDLRCLGYDFVLLSGAPDKVLPEFVSKVRAGAVVTDFDPLRIKRQWQDNLSRIINIPLIEVDGHNVVPVRFVTDKREYGARTIRPKIHRQLPEFLEEFPEFGPNGIRGDNFPAVDWEQVRKCIVVDELVGPVDLPSGEAFAHAALNEFVAYGLGDYADKRNDPNAEATSRLSAYYHFGQLAPQRAALIVADCLPGEGAQSYLEELIVRRELADNFCLHTPNYDSLDSAPEWALKTLAEHSADARAYLYTYDYFEQSRTHSALWNAAQNQMVRSGFMHGYMRMFWAKKILEWSASPEDALKITIALNDRYELDGRDPNGYVGALWSVAGLHDRGWKKRPVFGSIRYMNERGCRRKFDVDTYIEKWNSVV